MRTDNEDIIVSMLTEVREDVKKLTPRVAVIEAKIATYVKVAGVFGAAGGAVASWAAHLFSGRH